MMCRKMIRMFEAPRRVRGLDVLLLLQRQHLTAHDARDVGPAEEREHDDHRELDVDGERPDLVADIPDQELALLRT